MDGSACLGLDRGAPELGTGPSDVCVFVDGALTAELSALETWAGRQPREELHSTAPRASVLRSEWEPCFAPVEFSVALV